MMPKYFFSVGEIDPLLDEDGDELLDDEQALKVAVAIAQGLRNEEGYERGACLVVRNAQNEIIGRLPLRFDA